MYVLTRRGLLAGLAALPGLFALKKLAPAPEVLGFPVVFDNAISSPVVDLKLGPGIDRYVRMSINAEERPAKPGEVLSGFVASIEVSADGVHFRKVDSVPGVAFIHAGQPVSVGMREAPEVEIARSFPGLRYSVHGRIA